MNMNTKDVCRLCGSENGIHVNIFNGTSDWLAAIESVIPDVIILRNDCLSKLVCHRCVAKVKDFDEFKKTCIRTQNMLKGRLSWLCSGIKNEKKVPPRRPVSPMVTFLGGPLAHPYGDPEPEVEILTLSDDEDPLGPSSSSPHSTTSVPSSSRQISPLAKGPPPKKPCWSTNGPAAVIQTTPKRAASALFPDKGLQTGATGVPAPPRQPFRGFLEFTQQISSLKRQPLGNPQSPFKKNSRGRKTTIAGRESFPSARRKQSLDISSTSDPPISSALQEVSDNHINSYTVAQTVSSVVSNSNENSLPQADNKASNFGKSSSSDCNGPTGISVTQVVNKPSDNSPVNSVKIERKGTGEKPMPKCKKRIQKDLTEEDVTRICLTYPQLNPLKICENTIILTCSGCSTILTKEDAVIKHKCCIESLIENSVEKVEPGMKDSRSLFDQNDESNHSTSSSVELICSDDEISNCKPDAGHSCNVCGKKFLNLARLEKHELSHISTEASGESR